MCSVDFFNLFYIKILVKGNWEFLVTNFSLRAMKQFSDSFSNNQWVIGVISMIELPKRATKFSLQIFSQYCGVCSKFPDVITFSVKGLRQA